MTLSRVALIFDVCGLLEKNSKEAKMKVRKKVFDFEYEEVLDTRTRELIRVACAIAVGCPD